MATDIFKTCSQVEARSLAILIPWLEHCGGATEIVKTENHTFLQKTYGDLVVRAKNGQFEIAEFKSEVSESTRTGNLFLESWSNRERGEVGWLHKSVASVLFYHFLGDDHLFILRMKALKEWALRDKVIDRFKERMQSKHVQANDTYGWCVPISVLKNEMPRGTLKIHRPKSELDSYARSKNVTENEESFISTLF